MKKTAFILLSFSLLLFVSCVSKQKYADLESRYNKTSQQLQTCLAERNAFNEETGNLSAQIAGMMEKTQIIEAESRERYSENLQLKKYNEELKSQIEDANKRLNEAVSAKGTDLKRMNDELNSSREALNKKTEELDAKDKELSTMQEKFVANERMLQSLQQSLQAKEDELEAIEQKISSALLGFTDKGLSVVTKDGKVYVSLEEKLLFPSGSWEINSEGAAALKEIANVLANNPDISVLVEGHTDNVPFKGKSLVKDNWDLSVMRATSVTRILLEDKRISPERIIPAGRGEFMPLMDNRTTENRARNRRTEIILSPKVDELMKIISK
ncbi:MAG: OmpA family protein [Bacteroidales bacterium]|jgi:chemotaxis protein MotB|nr:OmpA family protein [Bacteroidales bacterium]